MNNKNKKILTLFALFIFLASNLAVFNNVNRTERTNQINDLNNDKEVQGDQIITDLPRTGTVESLQTTGSSIGITGYTDGTKDGSFGLADWLLVGGGYYETSTSYPMPFPVSAGGTSVVPTWNFDKTIISVSNLEEENDFYWDKDFNTGDWSNSASVSGTYGTAATVGQMNQNLDSGRDFYNDNVGYVDFNNYQTSYSLSPNGWDSVWVDTNNYARSQSAYTNSDDNGYTSSSGTEMSNTNDYGIHPDTSHAASRSPSTNGFSSSVDIATGYHLYASDGEDHDHNDWANCGMDFDDRYTYITYAKDELGFVYDGTIPYDVDFSGYIQLSRSQANLADTRTTMISEQDAYINIDLISEYDPQNIRVEHLYAGSYSEQSLAQTAISKTNIQSFFSDPGPYYLQVKLHTYLRVDANSVERSRGSSGSVTLDYAWMGNSGPASATYDISVSSLGLAFQEEKPYPEDYAYLESTIDFGERQVQNTPTPTFEFDYSIQNELIENEDTFKYGKIRARVEYVKDGTNPVDQYEWGITAGTSQHAIMTLSPDFMDGSSQILVRLGVYFDRQDVYGLELDWNSETEWSQILFANVEMNVKTIPKPGDVGLMVYWSGGESSSESFPTGNNGYGSITLDNTETNWAAGDNRYFGFRSTSQKLSFNYEQEIQCSFDTFDQSISINTVLKSVNGTTSVKYDASFDWNVPHDKTNLKSGYDFSDSFNYTIAFPRYLDNGEPYWNLDGGTLNTGSYTEEFSGAEGASWSPESQVHVLENTNYKTYSDTQVADVGNDLFDEYTSVDEFNQEWELNFTAPNLISDMIIDNEETFTSCKDQIIYSNYSNIRVNYGDSIISTGETGAKWINSLEENQYSSIIDPADGNYNIFSESNSNAWDTTGAVLGDYFAVTNYTAGTTSDFDIPSGMSGISRFGYMYKPFSVVQDTEIEWLSVTPKLYNTETHGRDGDLINITAKWNQIGGGGGGLTDATAKISIAQFEVDPEGEKKEPVVPAEWSQQDMIDNGDGTYSAYVDPTFYAHTGNLTWGFHNFTISFSKTNYISREIKDDFNIIVDSKLQLIDPDQDSVDPKYNHPHFKYGIMGGNESGTPSDYMTAFSLYFFENKSDPTYFTNNPGNPYRNMVEINYTCTNFTKGHLSWWNWSWNEQEFSESNSGNPINGTFKASGTEWTSTIYFPQKGNKYFQNVSEYESGIYLEYNVTARIKTNSTYPPIGDPYNFQPNIVESQTCEDGFAVGNNEYDTYKEETILVQLLSPEEGNFTRLVAFNDKSTDGSPFAMGTYDNKSTAQPFPYEEPVYRVKQYYNNQTTGPHGRPENQFRLRVLFNGTYQLKEQERVVIHPPCGPLNSSGTTMKLYGWETGTALDLTPDTDYLWSTEVKSNETGSSKTYYGVTYVTDWLNFTDKKVGTYDLWIRASKPGYKDSMINIQVEILAQKTELLLENNTLISNDANKNGAIDQEIPHGNITSFVITYNDITNEGTIGSQPIPGAEIICTGDTLNAYNHPFENNLTATGESTWRWVDEENGNYTIYLDYTEFSALLEDPSNTQISFEITSDNSETRKFSVLLNITKRQIQINLLEYGNTSVYTERDFKTYRFLTYEFEIIDLDNNSNPVNFDLSEGKNDAFIFKYWNNSVPLTDIDYSVIRKYKDGSTLKYNITIDNKFIDVGAYELMFKIFKTGNFIYYTTSLNTSFEVVPAPITVNLIDSIDTIEYLISTLAKDSIFNYIPKFTVKFIDTIHTARSGAEKLVYFSGMSVDTNFSNPYYSVMNTYSSVSSDLVNEDLRVLTRTANDGIIEVYVDSQRIDQREQAYSLNITFSKENYVTTNFTTAFTVLNASTILKGDNVKLNWQEGEIDPSIRSSFPSESDDFYNESIASIPWGKFVGIRLSYLTESSDKGIGAEIPDISEVYTNIIDLTTSMTAGAEAEFLSSINFYDESSGVHYIDFPLNFTDTGTVSINFTFSLRADNFDPLEFPIHLIVNDRQTEYLNVSRTTEVEWTQKATVVVNYADNDYNPGSILHYMREGCFINGTPSGSGSQINLDGDLAQWNFTEYPGKQEFQFEIRTDNLTVGEEYKIYLNLSKPHYEEQIIPFIFSITPVSMKVNYTVFPSEEFKAEDVEMIEIHLSIFVNLQNGSGQQEIMGGSSLLPNITVTYTLESNNEIIYEGEFEWSDSEEKWVASFATHDEKNDPLTGIFELTVNITTNYANVKGEEINLKLFGFGQPPAEIPGWFYILLMAVIGAAVAMAGYGIRKALYLRIPFVLRKIDETIKKIEKDKYPAVGVMAGRQEFIINKAIEYLDECGIQWEREDKFEIKKVGEAGVKEELPPFSEEEIKEQLNQISGLSKEEASLFVEELKRLDREAQEEFLASLRGDLGETGK